MITLDELLQGKETEIKNKSYHPTIKYVQPFINKVKDVATGYKIFVKRPDQITDGAMTYNRVLVQAFTKKVVNGYTECICFSYALDVRKPVAKIYKCYINPEGLMLAFNPMWLSTQPIEPEEVLEYSAVTSVLSATDNFETEFDKIESTELKFSEFDTHFGRWMKNSIISEHYSEFGKVKISTASVIDAYKSMVTDEDSDRKITVQNVSKMDVLEAFAQTVADDNKDFINKFEKTLLINTILS